MCDMDADLEIIYSLVESQRHEEAGNSTYNLRERLKQDDSCAIYRLLPSVRSKSRELKDTGLVVKQIMSFQIWFLFRLDDHGFNLSIVAFPLKLRRICTKINTTGLLLPR